MSAGISGMIISLRANRIITRKHEPFRKDLYSRNGKGRTNEFDFPSASEKELKKIRKEMIRENRKLVLKRTISFILIMGVLLFTIYKIV
ncbi:hypothetical protein GWK08_00960 [Leptobacterium flavescens]|uniref:Uncharacterized protein n=1 Tax=Leptobacterium flavescens TaxID=472055 RepID=A0A6P0UG55_9FLAO|nr:hypothetical protein [Leptobacterium flavescens]NER11997.1 hypothetical protein [Leptobacterium flavescens]